MIKIYHSQLLKLLENIEQNKIHNEWFCQVAPGMDI